jgi:glycine cleavage system H protein
MNIPDELKYTKDHEWVKVDGDLVTVGITDYAQNELGDVVYVELPEPGQEVEKDESFGTIEAVKAVADLFCPVSGEIMEINEELGDDPEIVNKNPYGDGWMVKIRLSDTTQIDGLMSADDYIKMIG